MRNQIHVVFSGHVQGVGFRFSARSIACDLGLTGWVKNLSDGSVEVVAEGEEQNLREFLDRMNTYFSRYITSVDPQWGPATEGFSDFRIAH